ncbi:MAG TPA: hypothetical protein VH110_07070 [Candidatus Acidoferrum sp.]|jgi:hypothetical protein|nr:hypothetical protein [Candidatus Acidoferrum sp.]
MATKRNKKKKKQTKRKKAVTKKAAAKKNLTRRKALSKKAAPRRKPAPKGLKVRGKIRSADTVVFEPRGLGARSGPQSGDLQGLSNTESAASESVDELLEEGNAFEAEVVKGVEDASDADEGEVVTHEVPEDDVPEEYRDKDR